jgi:hypothetical protein
MRARDIQPGQQYARTRAGYLPDRVTVTSVTRQRVSYVDDRGKRGHVRPGDITGAWLAHEAALARAEAARDRLAALADEWLLGAWLAYRDDRAAVAEGDEFGVTVQPTPQQADRLADLLRVPRRRRVSPRATARPGPAATSGSRRPGHRRARR